MMPAPSPLLSSVYLVMKSVAPEKATWAMYLTISSSDMPMPLSMKVSVPFSLSVITSMRSGASSPWAWPLLTSQRYLRMASQPLATSSRMKMSLSEYSHCLMTGMMFSACIETVPFDISITSEFLIYCPARRGRAAV